VVDPFAAGPVAPGACPAQPALWSEAAGKALAYRRGAVLNTGFSAGPTTSDAIEAHAVTPPGPATALAAYARLINLEAGDVVDLKLTGPRGEAVAAGAPAPLDHDKAQWTLYVGRAKAPAGGWPHGAYTARLEVRRKGAVALSAEWRSEI